jgi:hypothetical protein
VRLFNKPQERDLSVLVPPGTAPRLIPGDSPNATRPSGARVQMTRQPPAVVTHVDYSAAFSDSGKGKVDGPVDYLLLSSDERR